jgi:hypothetical protein
MFTDTVNYLHLQQSCLAEEDVPSVRDVCGSNIRGPVTLKKCSTYDRTMKRALLFSNPLKHLARSLVSINRVGRVFDCQSYVRSRCLQCSQHTASLASGRKVVQDFVWGVAHSADCHCVQEVPDSNPG